MRVRAGLACGLCGAGAVMVLMGAGVQPGAGGGGGAGRDGSAVRGTSPVSLSEARERALSALFEMTTSSDAQVRANAIEGLSQVPARVRRVLPAALADANVGVRSVAAMVAGRERVREMEGALRALTRESSAYAQMAGIYGLSRIGASVDPSPLARFLLEDNDPRVRAQAAFVLGELGEKSAMGLLAEAAAAVPRGDPAAGRSLRLQIAEAMVKIGDGEQTSVLHAALFPSRPEELEASAVAAQILGELGDREAVGMLVSLTNGADQTERAMPAEVRLAAAEALAKLGYTDGGFVADEYLESPNPAIRAQAVSLAGHLKDRGRVDRLLEVMQTDGSEMVRVAAAAAVVRATSR